MLLGIHFLINLLLILAGPFAVVGGVALLAEACGADLLSQTAQARRAGRHAVRWAVA